jgi:hypothetical protein
VELKQKKTGKEATRYPCYDFLNIFVEKFGQNLAIFLNVLLVLQKFDHNIVVFCEKRHFFRR